MSEVTITGFKSRDVRFPTSLDKTGSDAMNAAGDYSAAYCVLETDSKHSGHGMVSVSLSSTWVISSMRFVLTNSLLFNRHSPSGAETTSSVLPSSTLPIDSRARPFHHS